MHVPHHLLLAALLGSTPLLPAQDPALVATSATGLADCNGVLRGDGPSYKALFHPHGIEFVPAFGARVAEEQPLQLTLRSIVRGEHTVLDQPANVPPERHQDRTVRYPRAAGIAEHFDVQKAGVELSVHFAAPLPGHGDLVVTYDMHTTLGEAEPTADGGVAFRREGAGAITIGAVTGIDADGDRVQGRVQLLDAAVQFVLPAAFVDAASFPLVLDPLLGAQFAPVATGGDDLDPDACYGPSSAYGVVFRRAYASNSADILLSLTSTSAPMTLTVVEGGAAIGGEPTIAHVTASSRTLVAWTERASLFSQRDIRCRAFNGWDTVGTAVAIAATAADECEPELAGNNLTGTGNDYALCAYTIPGTGLQKCRVQVLANSTCVVGATAALQLDAAASQPAISQSALSSQPYLVVWRTQQAGQWLIRTMPVDAAWNSLGATVVLENGTQELLHPAVDGSGLDYLCAWERIETNSSTLRDVRARGQRWNGTALTNVGSTITIGAANMDDFAPAVGACGKFLVAYAAQFPLSSNVDLRAVELDAACAICGPGFLLQGRNQTLAQNIETTPAIATVRSSGGANASDSRALLVFAEVEDVLPFASTLVAQQYQAFGTGSAPVVGTSCGAGSIGRSGGFPQVGNTAFGITLAGAPVGSVPFLLIGFLGTPQACGTCSVLNIVTAQFVPGSGSASAPFPFPCSHYPFLGLGLEAQWAVLGAPTSPCPLAAGVAFSNRLQMTVQL